MNNKQVFIGWSGNDNREIAQKLKAILATANYPSIVGGEGHVGMTVHQDMISQMNGCDLAIFFIEKEERRNDKGELISKGFNPNVMLELGYMRCRTVDSNRIKLILINIEPNELPSDLQGSWCLPLKSKYTEGDEQARQKALDAVAEKTAKDFIESVKSLREKTNKLDYFDCWEENVLDIYNQIGQIRISEKLIYGMQAAIYSGEYERLYQKLLNAKEQLAKKDLYGDYPCVACAIAILSVFVVTKRLTEIPTEQQFYELTEALEQEYEKNIESSDLSMWCKIFRLDKQELCYELFAASIPEIEGKIEHYYEALKLCYQIIDMIEAYIADKNDEIDTKYALLYKAFSSRNISQICKNLASLEPEKKDEHLAKQKEYCAITLGYRKELYDFYKTTSRESAMSMDFVSQEYVLALAEQHKFETSYIAKKKIVSTVESIYSKWQDRNKIRNMIFEKVEIEVKGLSPKLKEEK